MNNASLLLIKLSAKPTLGAYWFSRPVPEEDAARFNLAAEAGAGVELAIWRERALGLGYRYQHVSNAGTAPRNVGLDSHLLSMGLRFAR